MEALQTFFSSTSGILLSIILIVIIALLSQAFIKLILQRSSAFHTRKDLFKTTHDRQKRIKTINGIINAIVGIGVWSVAFLLILDALGVTIGPIIASLGIMGAAIAFGTQSLIRDFVSGIFIIAENQFKVDDYVNIGSISGKVENVSVRVTTVRGDDGTLSYIPNGSISSMTNLSTGPIRETIKVELAGDTNLNNFAKQLTVIAKKLQDDVHTADLVQDGPTIAGVVSANKKGINVNIEFKTTASKRQDATSAIWRALILANEKKTIVLG